MNEDYLIAYLKNYNGIKEINEANKNIAIRSLMNITIPSTINDEFYKKQDEYLQEILSKKQILKIDNFKHQINLVLADITLIKADAIVNACNSELLGCFVPLHNCIDNAIHSFAGLQVRRDCLNLMEKQGHEEENGKCKVTKAYNLPSKFIFHTVGPIINGKVTSKNRIDLKNCYLNCLKKADEMNLNSIVFCSISTGVYGFPISEASNIAISTVKEYIKLTNTKLKIVFDVFSKEDYKIYESKL